MRVTRATDDDLAEIADGAGAWSDPFPAASTWWVVDGDPEHGYAGAEVRGDVLHLTRCYVHADLRGKGVQQRLVRVRMAWGRRQGCVKVATYTWAKNVPSIRALQRTGFLITAAVQDGETIWQTWERAL